MTMRYPARGMRIVGVFLLLAGSVGTAVSVQQSFARGRARGALFGLLAPLCVLAALTGALLLFVPDFFG
jgi:hypothetical protein